MKIQLSRLLSVCCAIALGAFMSTETLAQGGETCATAEVVTPGSYTAGELLDLEPGYQDICGDGVPGFWARWYSFTPDTDGFLSVASCLGGADTRLSIGSGVCGALVCEANADDECPLSEFGLSFASEISNLPVTGGTTYYIQWDDRWSISGFDWTLSFVGVLPPDCEGTPGGDVGEGDPCDDGNDLTFNDVYDAECNCAGTPECTGTPGGTTGPGASCDDGNSETFNDVYNENCMCVGTPIGPGASCDDAIDVEPGTYVSGQMVGGAGYQDICGDGVPGENARWYSFTPPSDGTMSVSSCDGGSDTRLSIGTGECGAFDCFANTDDDCSVSPGGLNFAAELLDLPVSGGTTYYIQWDDRWDGDEFSWTLSFVSSVPPCEDPYPAVDPSSLSSSVDGGSVTASWDPIPGQAGCQVQGRIAGGPGIPVDQVILGPNTDSYSVDVSSLPDGDYEWRVRCGCAFNIGGPWSDWQLVTLGEEPTVTSSPNPTDALSFVSFSVPTEGTASLEVYDMSGRVVDALFTGMAQPNNEYRFEFDGSNLPNGVYIYRLTTENNVVNEKFMIARQRSS